VTQPLTTCARASPRLRGVGRPRGRSQDPHEKEPPGRLRWLAEEEAGSPAGRLPHEPQRALADLVEFSLFTRVRRGAAVAALDGVLPALQSEPARVQRKDQRKERAELVGVSQKSL